jgi:hypothetical protein
MEQLEADHIFRNQQVAGSSPAGGSMFSSNYGSRPIVSLFKNLVE